MQRAWNSKSSFLPEGAFFRLSLFIRHSTDHAAGAERGASPRRATTAPARRQGGPFNNGHHVGRCPAASGHAMASRRFDFVSRIVSRT